MPGQRAVTMEGVSLDTVSTRTRLVLERLCQWQSAEAVRSSSPAATVVVATLPCRVLTASLDAYVVAPACLKVSNPSTALDASPSHYSLCARSRLRLKHLAPYQKGSALPRVGTPHPPPEEKADEAARGSAEPSGSILKMSVVLFWSPTSWWTVFPTRAGAKQHVWSVVYARARLVAVPRWMAVLESSQ